MSEWVNEHSALFHSLSHLLFKPWPLYHPSLLTPTCSLLFLPVLCHLSSHFSKARPSHIINDLQEKPWARNAWRGSTCIYRDPSSWRELQRATHAVSPPPHTRKAECFHKTSSTHVYMENYMTPCPPGGAGEQVISDLPETCKCSMWVRCVSRYKQCLEYSMYMFILYPAFAITHLL